MNVRESVVDKVENNVAYASANGGIPIYGVLSKFIYIQVPLKNKNTCL